MPRKNANTPKPDRDAAPRRRGTAAGVVARILAWVLILGALAAAGIGAVVGGRLLFITGNPHFVLRGVDIAVEGRMETGTVETMLADIGVRTGEINLFEIRTAHVRNHIESDIQVERAEVTRRLPGTLVVRVVERDPVAFIRSRPRFLIDGYGVLLPPREDSTTAFLPEITGAKTDAEMMAGMKLTDEIVTGALRFLQLVDIRTDGAYYDPRMIQLDYSLPALKIHLAARGTFRDGAQIVIPVRGMDDALDRLATIVTERTAANLPTSSIDVTYVRNVPVLP